MYEMDVESEDQLVFGSDLIPTHDHSLFEAIDDMALVTSVVEHMEGVEGVGVGVETPLEVKTEPQEVTESTVEETEFSVEAIVGKRKRNNRIEYCIKWLGFEDKDNTWEPMENLQCSELIDEYERTAKAGARRGRKPKPKTESPKATTKDGFARGLRPKRVLGVTEARGQLLYSVEWTTGDDEPELVPSRVARERCPQLVIQFLQSKLVIKRKGPKEPLESYRPTASKQFSLFGRK